MKPSIARPRPRRLTMTGCAQATFARPAATPPSPSPVRNPWYDPYAPMAPPTRSAAAVYAFNERS